MDGLAQRAVVKGNSCAVSREGPLKRIESLGRLVVPVVFILMLPVAFASSTKNEDKVDNSFAFAFDSDADDIVAATSSKRYKFDDDVDFSVTVSESDNAELPLVARVRFRLLDKEPIRYDGTIHFKIVALTGGVSHSEDRPISFTLRRTKGERSETILFPFEVPSGDYRVGVTFSG